MRFAAGLGIVAAVSCGSVPRVDAQAVDGPTTGTAVPIALARPEYPPSLQALGVAGEVVLRLWIVPDGSVRDAQPVGGRRQLWAAAVPAAGMSTFECRGCGPDGQFYSVVYVFTLTRRIPDRQPPPIVEHGRARVTVVAVGRAVPPDDMPMEAARTARCLWLWPCGLRPFEALHGGKK